MKRRFTEITKTLVTPTVSCDLDVHAGSLIKSFEIPPDLIDASETETIGKGSFGTCSKVILHGTTICAKSFRPHSSSGKSLVVQEASILVQVRHPYICFLLGIQTKQEPFQLLTIFYNVDGVSLSVYDAFPYAKLDDAKKMCYGITKAKINSRNVVGSHEKFSRGISISTQEEYCSS